MTAFFLTVIILALVAYIVWSDHEHRQERRHLTHIAIAKNTTEVARLDDPPFIAAPFVAKDETETDWTPNTEPIGI